MNLWQRLNSFTRFFFHFGNLNIFFQVDYIKVPFDHEQIFVFRKPIFLCIFVEACFLVKVEDVDAVRRFSGSQMWDPDSSFKMRKN